MKLCFLVYYEIIYYYFENKTRLKILTRPKKPKILQGVPTNSEELK